MAYSTVVLPPGFGNESGSGPGGGSGGSNEGGPFTGALLAPFGSAAAPGYSFVGAPNMGLYGVSLGVLGLASQGRQIAQLDQAGNLMVTGGLNLQGGFLTEQGGSLLINTSQATPVGNVVAPPGSLFRSALGGANGLFFKQSGTDASGWVPVLGPRSPTFPITAPTSAASSLPYAFSGFAGTGWHSLAGELALSTGNTDRLVLGTDGSVALNGPAAVSGTLSVIGTTSLTNLSVGGSTVLRSGATVQGGALTAQTGLSVTGGDLQVAGLSTFGGRVSVSGLLTATAGSALSGGVTLDAGAQIINAPGDPRGNVAAPAGSVFLSSDGGVGRTFYVKETGINADGWALGSSAGGGGVVYPLFAPQSADGFTPQYAFEGGSAGLLSPEAKTLALSTDGVARLVVGPTGNTSLYGNVSVSGALTVGALASFSSAVDIAGALSVAGTSSLAALNTSGDAQLGGALRVQAGTYLNGATSIGGTFGVSGLTTLSGALESTGGATFGSTEPVIISAPLSLQGLVTLQAGNYLLSGSASPQGQITAPQGSTYSRTGDGSFWVKQTGSDANGWVMVPTSGLPQSSFPLQAPDGDATAPSYSFLASPGTGLFLSGPDELGLATAGALRLRLLSSGDVSFSGTASVGGALDVAGQTRLRGGANFIGSGPINVGGQTHFSDSVTLDGTLTCAGAATLGGLLEVSGATTLAALTASSGTFSGALRFADGTATLPGVTLGSATGTGFFADAAHTGLGVSVAGSQVGYFNAAGYTSTVGTGVIGTATSYNTTDDGTVQMPAYAINGRGGLFYDGTGVGLAVGVGQVFRGTASAFTVLQPTVVQNTLSTTGSLSVGGASMYGKSLVIGAGLQGQSSATNGALIEGQLAQGGGTVTLPGYAFVGATGTGLFADTAHQGIGVSVSGVQVGYFNTGGFTSTATGPSAPLIDLVVNSAQSTNLTLGVQGSTTSIPTATFLGTYSAAASYQQAGVLAFAVKDTSNNTVNTLYTLSAGGFPSTSLTLAKAGGGAPILSYSDDSGTTTLGRPVSVGQLSATSRILLPSATAAAPGLAFTASTPTGLFYDASHSGIGVTVGGTQIGYFNASGYNPLTGGTAMNVVAPIVTVNSGTYQLTAGQSGCFVNFTASATAALPAANAAALGTYFTFMVGAAGTTASVAIASSNTSDSLYFVGGTITAGQALTSQANRYALLSVECSTLGQWTVSSIQGVWGGGGVTVSQTDTLITSPGGNNLTLDSSGAPGTSASLRLIGSSGNPGVVRFASGTPASFTDVWTVSGLATGTAAFKLTHSANAYDVLSYTDTANTVATRNLVFGSVNVTGVRNLTASGPATFTSTLSVGASTAPSSTAGIFGNLTIGAGIAGTTAAPTNGLLVQGNTALQGTLAVTGTSTFTGNVTFAGGTTGVTAAASFPLAGPTGTTATPVYSYGFTGATTSGLNYNTTTGNVVLSQNGTAALTVSGPTIGLGGFSAVADISTPVQLSTPASANRVIAFLNQGANGVSLGYNNDPGGPLGLWFRAKGTTDAFTFTTTNGVAGAVNYAVRIGPNGGTSFGSSSAAPPNSVATLGGIFSGPSFPSTLSTGVYFLASASAETGSGDTNGVTAQISSTGKLYARFSLADSNLPVGDLSYNKYTADGVPVSVNINCYNKPFLLNVGADYTRTAMSAYNVANSYFCNIGSKTQSLSTLGVTGSLAVGTTVAAGTAAPTNGLLVQGNTALQGNLAVGGTVAFTVAPADPVLAAGGNIVLTAAQNKTIVNVTSASTVTLPAASAALIGSSYTATCVATIPSGFQLATASASDVLYWGGPITGTNAPTNKASGTLYTNSSNAVAGTTITALCVAVNKWVITNLIGSPWV